MGKIQKNLLKCPGEQLIWVATILLSILLTIGVFRYGLKSMLTPISAAIIGNVTTYIAYQQWQTNKLKIRLDLYERRFKIYSVFSDKIGLIINSKKMDNAVLLEFEKMTGEVHFLINTETEKTIENIIGLCSEMNRLQERIDQRYPGLPSDKGESPEEATNKIMNLFDKLEVERVTLNACFLPYLDFRQIG